MCSRSSALVLDVCGRLAVDSLSSHSSAYPRTHFSDFIQFILERVITIVAGLVSPFFLIEFPERAKFLSEHQQHVALERVRLEKEKKEIVHPTVVETLTMLVDWKLGL